MGKTLKSLLVAGDIGSWVGLTGLSKDEASRGKQIVAVRRFALPGSVVEVAVIKGATTYHGMFLKVGEPEGKRKLYRILYNVTATPTTILHELMHLAQDIVAKTPEEVESWTDSVAMLYKPILEWTHRYLDGAAPLGKETDK